LELFADYFVSVLLANIYNSLLLSLMV